LNYRDMRKKGECLPLTVLEFIKRLISSRDFIVLGDKPAEPVIRSD